jgi:tRNA pseudouridine13 synthase
VSVSPSAVLLTILANQKAPILSVRSSFRLPFIFWIFLARFEVFRKHCSVLHFSCVSVVNIAPLALLIPSLSKTNQPIMADTKTDTKSNEHEYDKREESLGIATYMAPDHPGFSAVVKARYSDFVVHEVNLQGKMARLETQELLHKPADGAVPVPVPVPQNKRKRDSDEPDWPSLKSQLVGMIQDETIATSVIEMLQNHNKKEEERVEGGEKFVILPSSMEKEQRKSIHEWVRECLTCARADTVDGNIRIWHLRYEKEMPNYKAFGTHKFKKSIRTKDSWPKDRPDFLRFAMYKENIDTMTATKELSKRGSKARIGYAGMKDKRGITTQFCTLYKTEPQQILSVSKNSGGGNSKQNGLCVVQVGNFEYVDAELRLGMLTGNRFDIVLRNVQGATKDELQAAAKSLLDRGFINYFGTQRFGKFYDTHLVGIEVLKGDFRKACDIILRPKPDERPDIAKIRVEWQDRFKETGETPEAEAACAKKVVRSLSRFMTAENSILQNLARKPMDYQQAFTRVPKTLRLMFLHAVQSLVWNKVASHRVEQSRDDVLLGDLVQASHDAKDIKVVTQEDLDNKKFTLEDVVLPLVGTKTKLPENESGKMAEKLFEELGVSMDMLGNIQDRDLTLVGDYRKLLCRPKDVDSSIIEYYDELQPLIQTDLMKLNGQELTILPKKTEEDKPLTGMVVGFTLTSSSYATIALRELMKRPTSSEYQKELKLGSS